jgi:hypothetical protein
MGNGKKPEMSPGQAFADKLENHILQQLKDDVNKETPLVAFRGTVQAMDPHTDDMTEFITLRIVFNENSKVNKTLRDYLGNKALLIISYSHLIQPRSSDVSK